MRTVLVIAALATLVVGATVGCKKKEAEKVPSGPATAADHSKDLNAEHAGPAVVAGEPAKAGDPAVNATSPVSPASVCDYLGVGGADAYSGLKNTGKITATPEGMDGCAFTTPEGALMKLVVSPGPTRFDEAGGAEVKVAMLDKAKWDEQTKTLAGLAKGKSIVVSYGPAATQSDQAIAGGAAQFVVTAIK